MRSREVLHDLIVQSVVLTTHAQTRTFGFRFDAQIVFRFEKSLQPHSIAAELVVAVALACRCLNVVEVVGWRVKRNSSMIIRQPINRFDYFFAAAATTHRNRTLCIGGHSSWC